MTVDMHERASRERCQLASFQMRPKERCEEHGAVGNGARYRPVGTQIHRLVAEDRETARFQHNDRGLVLERLGERREHALEMLTRRFQ
jgi:hypothetical protein